MNNTYLIFLLLYLLMILIEFTLSHGTITKVIEMGNHLLYNLKSDFTKVLVLLTILLFIIATTYITIHHLPNQIERVREYNNTITLSVSECSVSLPPVYVGT